MRTAIRGVFPHAVNYEGGLPAGGRERSGTLPQREFGRAGGAASRSESGRVFSRADPGRCTSDVPLPSGQGAFGEVWVRSRRADRAECTARGGRPPRVPQRPCEEGEDGALGEGWGWWLVQERGSGGRRGAREGVCLRARCIPPGLPPRWVSFRLPGGSGLACRAPRCPR